MTSNKNKTWTQILCMGLACLMVAAAIVFSPVVAMAEDGCCYDYQVVVPHGPCPFEPTATNFEVEISN